MKVCEHDNLLVLTIAWVQCGTEFGWEVNHLNAFAWLPNLFSSGLGQGFITCSSKDQTSLSQLGSRLYLKQHGLFLNALSLLEGLTIRSWVRVQKVGATNQMFGSPRRPQWSSALVSPPRRPYILDQEHSVCQIQIKYDEKKEIFM